MYSQKREKIFDFIRESGGTRAKDIMNHLGGNAAGIFRHLKRLQGDGRVYKIGKPPQVRYYAAIPAEGNASALFRRAANWAVSGDARWIKEGEYCQTRDVLRARTARLMQDLKKIVKDNNRVYLLLGAVEEIGNNSYDHNIGQWRDIPGVFLGVDAVNREIVVVDRGQGVFATIRRVEPEVENSAQALRVAFTKIISGRAPEKRGNGLKFVKKVMEEYGFSLVFFTGDALSEIRNTGMIIKESPFAIPGTLAHIIF